MNKLFLIAIVASVNAISGCAIIDTLTCPNEDWVGRTDILNNWIGRDINAYERSYGVQPTSNMPRPQNRIRYQYRVMSGYNGPDYWYCDDSITVDNNSGQIVDWSFEGNNCSFESYCAKK